MHDLEKGDKVGKCPDCGKDLIVRENRKTKELFIGCTGYPNCDYSQSIDDYHEPGDFSWLK